MGRRQGERGGERKEKSEAHELTKLVGTSVYETRIRQRFKSFASSCCCCNTPEKTLSVMTRLSGHLCISALVILLHASRKRVHCSGSASLETLIEDITGHEAFQTDMQRDGGRLVHTGEKRSRGGIWVQVIEAIVGKRPNLKTIAVQHNLPFRAMIRVTAGKSSCKQRRIERQMEEKMMIQTCIKRS